MTDTRASLHEEIHDVMHQVDLTMHREENYYRPGVTRPTAEDWKERVRWLYAVLLKVVATSALAAPAAPPETRNIPVEDELCAAAMDGVSVVEHQGKYELRFDMKRLREGFRRAFARTSGSCLICGVKRAFVVMANGVGICEPCRYRAAPGRRAPAQEPTKDNGR